MKTFRFAIVTSGISPEEPHYADRFFEAGCDDATVVWQRGRFVLDFEREAESFDAALNSAIRDVREAGAEVERIEPDPLVNASDIASRANMSRAAVSLYAKGERGHGFPAPVARVTTESPLWDWAEVAAWLSRDNRLSASVVADAVAVRNANLMIAGSVTSSPPQTPSTPASAPSRARRG